MSQRSHDLMLVYFHLISMHFFYVSTQTAYTHSIREVGGYAVSVPPAPLKMALIPARNTCRVILSYEHRGGIIM